MLERVAVIGLGNMGLPIARNLLRAGFPLTVHTRTKAKAEPLVAEGAAWEESPAAAGDRKSTRLNSSHGYISYAVFCLKKKKRLQNSRPRCHQRNNRLAS